MTRNALSILKANKEVNMIDLYYWTTPNGNKLTIFLEEAKIPYKIHPINIGKNEQFAPEFLKISPNNKIPAIVDNEPLDNKGPQSIFESGAILWYLAEKIKKFVPTDPREKILVSEWLFWQVGGLGPMAGQNHHFNMFATEKIPYAMERYKNETKRLYGVLDKQLSMNEFIAKEYSIADMAIYPWIVFHKEQSQDLNNFPNIKRWFEQIGKREAVRKAYSLIKEINPDAP